MRSSIFIALCVLFVFGHSCKKGEEDPFLSLKTRTARLKGDWKISQASWQEADSSAAYSNGQLSIVVPSFDESEIEASFNYSFDRQGSYRINRSINYPDNWLGTQSPRFTENYEETGIWQFTGGAGDSKSKSQLLLLPDKIQNSRFIGSALDITSFNGQYEGRVYDIVKLTDSEVILEYDREKADDTGTEVSKAQITLIRP